MSLQDIPLFSALTERMKWLTARQKVLSQNIANSDTPNYMAKDLKPQKFKDMVARPEEVKVQMVKTSSAHIQTAEKSDFTTKKIRDPYETTPTGNGVVLEEQMMNLAETQIQYQMTTSLYKKHVAMLKTALGRR
ncbi:flagellar basal body rod protein FlgB [Sneathiella chinensis]|uniref:Flagellar basal body rod protein FlgB n=1 Tax=Sneathiella chinensis TaxID=349750 RepID=A0ABQ5U5Z7_9PROT|nr:flagellar basal body rod protein FlgB [Sneathiella chinensis]GLQ07334.1 flagellar basal body rod protein FlgB [Sneathiella chinensis]